MGRLGRVRFRLLGPLEGAEDEKMLGSIMIGFRGWVPIARKLAMELSDPRKKDHRIIQTLQLHEMRCAANSSTAGRHENAAMHMERTIRTFTNTKGFLVQADDSVPQDQHLPEGVLRARCIVKETENATL